MALQIPGIKNPLFPTSSRTDEGLSSKSEEDITYLCKLYKTATQAIVNNTETAITWDAQNINLNEMHSTSTNNTRVTIKVPGVYICNLFHRIIQDDAPLHNLVSARVKKNGATVIGRTQGYWNSTQGLHAHISCIAFLEAGEYVEAMCAFWSNTGQDGDISSGIEWTSFEVYKIS